VNEWRLSLNNGSECIQIKDSFWQIEALSEDAGHGDTLDDGTIDEARFQVDDRTEAAMAPAMSTRRDPQKWIISTAGGADSPYLYRKVTAGRAACETGEHGTTAFFDWSSPDDADPGDPETWRGCSPALGHTITERFLQSEWDKAQREGPEAIDTFCQEYLNRWMEIPVLDDDDAGWILPRREYLAGADPDSRILADPSLAIAVSPDRQWAALAAAGASNQGGVHGGVLRYAEGTSWIVDEVKQWGASVSLAKDSPAMSLLADLEQAGIEVHQFSTQEQGQAFGVLFDLVSVGDFWHPEQPHLDLSVKCAELRLTEGGVSVLSPKRSTVDISPLVAVTLAVSKHLQPDSEPAPRLEWL
jgi:phage terminase large subunit-like protein